MPMTERERILAVYNGETPDRIPFMLDLSHYYYERFQKPWDLLNGYTDAEKDMIDYNKKFNAGFYLPNQAILSKTVYSDYVRITIDSKKINGVPEIHWKFETPIGTIERIRVWEQGSYSWAIKKWGVVTEQDLKVLGYAMSQRTFEPLVENYLSWKNYVGDSGVVYMPCAYSAMGYLLNYWMGIENTMYATVDMNETMHEVIGLINDSNLKLIEMFAKDYPCEVLAMGDNFDSSIQPPSFFAEWSSDYYRKAVLIAHKYGKKVAVHIDGKLRGSLSYIRDTGADCIDAVTPYPMGDLTSAECRDEAGTKLILSGGVSPDLWLPEVPVERFKDACLAWINLSKRSSAMIAAAGDQVPPHAEECRIEIYRELVDKYGNY
jgi:hypothetical protein